VAIEELAMFRKDVGTYIKQYDFLSQLFAFTAVLEAVGAAASAMRTTDPSSMHHRESRKCLGSDRPPLISGDKPGHTGDPGNENLQTG